jgi:hypothetical protein
MDQICECEYAAHFSDHPAHGTVHPYGANGHSAAWYPIMRTAYGAYQVCPECVKAGHILIKGA